MKLYELVRELKEVFGDCFYSTEHIKKSSLNQMDNVRAVVREGAYRTYLNVFNDELPHDDHRYISVIAPQLSVIQFLVSRAIEFEVRDLYD